MNKIDFYVEMSRLSTLKRIEVDELTIELYRSELSNLPYIEDALIECRSLIWYRDFDRTVTRFPECAEIKNVQKEIKRKHDLKPQPVYLGLPDAEKVSFRAYMEGKPEGYAKALYEFSINCMIYMELHCTEVWKYIESNNIEIPIDVIDPEKDLRGFKAMALYILNDGINNIRKVSLKGEFVNYIDIENLGL